MSPRPTSREISTRPAAVNAATTSWSGRPAGARREPCRCHARRLQDTSRRDGQVLVQLELHCDCGMPQKFLACQRGAVRSAARTPATVTVGYWAVICWVVMPGAIQSKITLTGTRCRRSRPGRASPPVRRDHRHLFAGHGLSLPCRGREREPVTPVALRRAGQPKQPSEECRPAGAAGRHAAIVLPGRSRRRRQRCRWRAGQGGPSPSYHIVVLGSACEAASCTSRSRRTRVQRRGDERVPEGVGSYLLGDPSVAGDAPHDPPSAVPVQPSPVGSEEDGPSQRSPMARSIARAVRGASGW